MGDKSTTIKHIEMRLNKSYGETLSIRESEVLDLLSKGHPNKEIAVLLGVGIRTIDTHVYSIFKKLNVKNRIEATNTMMRLDRSLKYKERLFNEWMQHGKIVIAVDFDDTVSPWKLNSVEEIEKSGIFELLRNAKYTGAYLVAFTACKEDRFQDIKGFFRSNGLELDSINQNPIELPYGNHSKIYANIFLDDRAGLNEAMEILNDAMYMYRGVLHTKNIVENSEE